MPESVTRVGRALIEAAEESLAHARDKIKLESYTIPGPVDANEILPEYDFSRARPNKFASRFAAAPDRDGAAGAKTTEGTNAMSRKHMGSSLDDFLKDEGILEAAQAQAVKEVVAWQLSYPAESVLAELRIERARRRQLTKATGTLSPVKPIRRKSGSG